MRSEWRLSTINEICSLVTDGAHNSPKSVINGAYMASVKDFTEYGLDFSSCRMISEEDYEKLRLQGCVPEFNDILVGKDGARYFEDIIIYKQPEKPALLSSIAILRTDRKKVIPEFLYYTLKSPSVRKDVRDNYGSGSAIPRIVLKDFKRMPIAFPPIDEQKKLVSIFVSIDEQIQNNNKINGNLQEQARALYRSWFVDFEPFDGSKPSNWKNGRLKDVLSLQRSSIKAGENTSLPYLPIDIIPMNTFGLSDVKPNEEAQSSLITFSKDDIVIGAMRVYFHRVIIAPFDGITRTTCFTLRPFNADYLGFSLLCCDQDSSIEYAQQTSKGSTMPYAVWDGGLGDMEIPIPDPKTAHRFNEIVMPMTRIIQSSFAENKNLRELRDSLLPRLMSGELDVSDLDL